jgi:uncharacterized protein
MDDDPKFIVDINAGRLVKWLRIMGYDAMLFTDEDDGQMIKIALQQNRIVLTKDTQILARRVVTGGKVKVLFIKGDDPKYQLKQVVSALQLDYQHRPFSMCSMCNIPLISRTKEQVRNRVPPHVFNTLDSYMECPGCNRIYWRGTHWDAMSKELISFLNEKTPQVGVK